MLALLDAAGACRGRRAQVAPCPARGGKVPAPDPRERQVFSLVVDGLSHKQIARQIGTSEVTTKVHKKSIMNKMQSRSLVELVAMHNVLGTQEGMGGA